MTPEEIAFELGTTPLQARMIHSEVTKFSSGEFSVPDLESGAPKEDPEAEAYNSKFSTMMEPGANTDSDQELDPLDAYNSRVTHPSQAPSNPPSFVFAANTNSRVPNQNNGNSRAALAAGAGVAVAGAGLATAGLYAASSPEIVPIGGEFNKLPTTYEYTPHKTQAPAQSKSRPVSRTFAYVWQGLALLLVRIVT